MNLEQLRIFVAVAERLHVTQAAKQLNMTQSAASATIASLEGRYGVRLFDRIGRHIALTEAGRALLQEGKRLLEHAATVEAALIEVSDLKRGSLAIQASLTYASYRLPQIMHDFRTRYPKVALSLRIANTAEVAEAVRQGAADLGFVEGRVDDPALARFHAGEDRLVLVVAPSHPWAARRRVEAEDLAQSPWVVREAGSGTRQVFAETLRGRGVDPERLELALELPSNEAVRTAVIAGAGAAALSRLVVETALRTGALTEVEFNFPARAFVALRRADRHLSRAEEAFLGLVAERAGGPARKARAPAQGPFAAPWDQA
jgi:DNA-binding transcriptional LysR family regulator